jgi:hypothetical protein
VSDADDLRAVPDGGVLVQDLNVSQNAEAAGQLGFREDDLVAVNDELQHGVHLLSAMQRLLWCDSTRTTATWATIEAVVICGVPRCEKKGPGAGPPGQVGTDFSGGRATGTAARS